MKRHALLTSGLIGMLLLGVVGTGIFLHFGGFSVSENESNGYLEVENWGNESVNVTIAVVDLQTENRVFKERVMLGVDGEESYFSASWPSMTAGKYQLTVTVGEDRHDSYDFEVGEDGTGPNLSVGIANDKIRFSLESGGL